MNKHTLVIVTAVLLAVILASAVVAQEAREIWMGGYMLLRIRNGAGGYSLDQRVAEIIGQRITEHGGQALRWPRAGR